MVKAENKELKAKLYDCMLKISNNKKEMDEVKKLEKELLDSYNQLSVNYEEQRKILDLAKDNLKKQQQKPQQPQQSPSQQPQKQQQQQQQQHSQQRQINPNDKNVKLEPVEVDSVISKEIISNDTPTTPKRQGLTSEEEKRIHAEAKRDNMRVHIIKSPIRLLLNASRLGSSPSKNVIFEEGQKNWA